MWLPQVGGGAARSRRRWGRIRGRNGLYRGGILRRVNIGYYRGYLQGEVWGEIAGILPEAGED